jgi:hypothetical protein
LVTLTAQNLDNLAVENVTLLDKYLNTTVDLKANNSYTFQNVPTVSDRFVVLLSGKSMTGLQSLQTGTPVQAYVSDNTLYVAAPSAIAEVSVTSLGGITAIKENSIGQTSYTKALSLPSGLYLISVKLATGETSVVKVRI